MASLCSTRIKASRQTVAKALHGNWDQALLFCLKTALEIYRFTQNKIQDCDNCVERQLAAFEIRTALPKATGNLRMQLHQICGVDLTKIPGIKEQSAQIIISEVGLDMGRWNTEKQFSSFLGLCPNNLITGGKILRRATRKVYRMLRYGENYLEKGIEHYEEKFRLQRIKWLKKEARLLNFQLVLAQ